MEDQDLALAIMEARGALKGTLTRLFRAQNKADLDEIMAGFDKLRVAEKAADRAEFRREVHADRKHDLAVSRARAAAKQNREDAVRTRIETARATGVRACTKCGRREGERLPDGSVVEFYQALNRGRQRPWCKGCEREGTRQRTAAAKKKAAATESVESRAQAPSSRARVKDVKDKHPHLRAV